MTAHRILNIAAAALLALAIGAAGHALDSLDDRSTDRALAAELDAAQRQAQRVARQERAADQLCIRTHGSNGGHRWAPDGSLVCTNHRGGQPVAVPVTLTAEARP